MRGTGSPEPAAVIGLPSAVRTGARSTTGLVDRLCQLLPDSGPLGLVGGPQVMSVAHGLRSRTGLLIVTNAVEVVAGMPARGGPTPLLLPGELGPTGTTRGPLVAEALGALNLDVVVVVADGLHPASGLSARDADEAAVVRAMVAASRRTAVLVPEAAVGRWTGGAECLDLDRVDLLVCPRSVLTGYIATHRIRKDAS